MEPLFWAIAFNKIGAVHNVSPPSIWLVAGLSLLLRRHLGKYGKNL